ncbi:MAG: hypothetical protein HON90_16985 [Halobacteriovoraceae bacterium]|jgi:hypothetical protein|nr:hypothetical protein [Halobacteriovoraceae bacterium]
MKRLPFLIGCLLTLSSCQLDFFSSNGIDVTTVYKSPKPIQEQNTEKKETEKTETEKSEKNAADSITTKYSRGDFASCMLKIAIFPIFILGDAISSILNPNKKVDLFLSEKVITLVKEDLDKYIKDFAKIEPRMFWTALSQASAKRLIAELILSYSEISDEEFEIKKQMIAYAFLYYLEVGNLNESYKFKFSSREEGVDDFTEYISFNGPKRVKEAKDVSFCDYFRFSDVATYDHKEVSGDVLGKLLCFDKVLGSYELTQTDNNELNLVVGKTGKEYHMNLSNVMTLNSSSESSLKLKFSSGWNRYPKLKFTLDRLSQIDSESKETVYFENKYKQMDLRITKYFLNTNKYKNLSCRTIKEFALE